MTSPILIYIVEYGCPREPSIETVTLDERVAKKAYQKALDENGWAMVTKLRDGEDYFDGKILIDSRDDPDNQ